MDEEGLEVCPKCGMTGEKILDFPLLDGTGRTRPVKVGIMCECRRKELEEREERARREEELRRIHELKKLSLMDEKLKSATFGNFKVVDENRKIFRIAQKYVENFEEMYTKNQGILFWGNAGTGKSYTAAAIANELLERLVPVIMTSFVKLIQDMEGYGSDINGYLNRLNRARLLIIDDLGAERGTDYALEKVYDIVDSRYRSNKPVILTTNLTMKEMQETADIRYSRIYDRIFEMCFPVYVEGKSWRKKEAVARFDEMKRILEA